MAPKSRTSRIGGGGSGWWEEGKSIVGVLSGRIVVLSGSDKLDNSANTGAESIRTKNEVETLKPDIII